MLCMTSEAYASQVCLSSGSCDRAPRCESDTRRFEHVMVRDSVMAVLTRLASEGRQFYAPFGGEVRGASYTSHVIAYDRANAVWIHYRRAQSRMAAGSMLLMDYAPDINYYTSGVTRSWPVSGKFSPRERELYGIYIKLFQAVESSMKPNVSPADISKDAVAKMDRIFAEFHFTDPKIKAAGGYGRDRDGDELAGTRGARRGGEADALIQKRHRSESNRRIGDLQSPALPLGHGAVHCL